MTSPFKVGDYVFAKVRGHPAWPAKISAILDPRPDFLKYTVVFYGTKETATVLAKDVYHYLASKEKCIRSIKRKVFMEGIQELEEDMKKSEKQKIDGGDRTQESKESKKSKKVSTETNEGVDIKNEPMSPEPDGKLKLSTPASKAAEGQKRKASRRKSEIEEAGPKKKRRLDSTSKSKTVDVEEEKAPAKSASNELDFSNVRIKTRRSVDESSEANQSKEQISRSGRVIKPKKFLDDEEKSQEEGDGKVKPKSEEVKVKNKGSQPQQAQKAKSDTDCAGSNPQSEKNTVESTNASHEGASSSVTGKSPLKLAPMGRVMWTKMKSGQVVQLKVDHVPPDKVEAKDRKLWEKSYEQELGRLKCKIEEGEAIPEEVRIQMLSSPARLAEISDEEIILRQRRTLVERKHGKLRWLKVETRLVDIDVLLKTCLQKTRVDIDKAFILMDELMLMPIDPLMLKKHPQIVETIKKIRQYIGNVDSWNWSPEKVREFNANTKTLRRKASIMLNKFRSLFAVSKPLNFWEVFLKSVTEFNTLTKDLPAARVYSLTVDPTSPLFNEVLELEREEDELFEEMKKEAANDANAVKVENEV